MLINEIVHYCYLYLSIVDDPRDAFYASQGSIIQKDDPSQKINEKNSFNDYFS